MFEAGTILDNLKIDELGFGGEGVGHCEDGAVIFIPFTAVGDVIKAEITTVYKNFYRGVVRKIVTPGQGRCAPVCPYYGRCGGCVYQHLDYEVECQAKAQQFKNLISRLGHFSEFPELECFTPSPERFGYRNKLRLEPLKDLNSALPEAVDYGFCERDNESFFPVKSCPLAREEVNAAIKNAKISSWGKQNATRRKPFPMTIRCTRAGETATYFGMASSKLKWLREELLEQEFRVPVGSFWQVNPRVAEMLLTHIHGWLQEAGGRSLIDAYAGVGTFSLALSDLFQYRVIIENDAQAVNASRLNHEQHNLKASFIAKPTEVALGQVLSKVKMSECVVILDPPRTGCMPKVLKELQQFKPATVLYVSCNPSTLARDLRTLCEAGIYQPVRCAAFDMFPATAHFESAVLLRCRTL